MFLLMQADLFGDLGVDGTTTTSSSSSPESHSTYSAYSNYFLAFLRLILPQESEGASISGSAIDQLLVITPP